MDDQQRNAFILGTVSNGVRWTSNILAELLGNYGTQISPAARDALKSAIKSLAEVSDYVHN